jgi:hypothetical protein
MQKGKEWAYKNKSLPYLGGEVMVMVNNALSTIFQLYHGSQFFFGGGNRRTLRKT